VSKQDHWEDNPSSLF